MRHSTRRNERWSGVLHVSDWMRTIEGEVRATVDATRHRGPIRRMEWYEQWWGSFKRRAWRLVKEVFMRDSVPSIF